MSGPAVVDVRIPTHGRPRYLRAAIESVVRQTFQHWTLVVSEDGSATDDVARVVAPYLDDPRVRLRQLGARLGAARHMSTLLCDGSATYVALLHDDDVWDPRFLARRVAFLDQHTDCALVFSDVTVIDEHGRALRTDRSALPTGRIPVESFLPALLTENPIPTPTVLVRRSAYRSVGSSFDSRFPAIYDYEMWIRLACRHPVGRLPFADARWRLHGRQSSYDPAHRRAAEYRRLLAHVETLLPAECRSDLPPRRVVRRNLSDRMLADALNATLAGEPRRAIGHLREALVTYPLRLADVRSAATLAGVLAPRSRHRLAQAVAAIRAGRIRVHLPAR